MRFLPWTLCLLCVLPLVAEEPGRRRDHTPKLSVLDNGTLRLGVDLNLGGAITYLSPSGKDDNLVNNWDWGRQIQMSHYAGPVPYVVGDKRPPKHWEHIGWNPVQAGDDHGHPSKLLDQRNDGKEIHVKCRPMQWPLDDEPAECVFESWIRLEGPVALVRCRMTNARTDHTLFPARTQELPAVYLNAPYHHLVTYSGDRPFAGEAVTRITYKPTPGQPWTSWMATESWAALVNDDGRGLGVWNPGCVRFSGGFAGKPGVGGTRDSPTGYLAPNRTEVLDHDIRYDFHYALILGTVDEIRREVSRRSGEPRLPAYDFTANRQGWHPADAVDAGWPIHGGLDLALEGADPRLTGPVTFWRAEQAPRLVLRAAFTTAATEAQVFWSPLAAPGFTEERSLRFPIRGDGQMRTYVVNLAASPLYRGGLVGLRLDPVPVGRPGERVRIEAIRLEAGP